MDELSATTTMNSNAPIIGNLNVTRRDHRRPGGDGERGARRDRRTAARSRA
jgi:hypothetical protein